MADVIPLSKPLKTHDGEVTELKLRDIDAADIVECRIPPFRFVDSKEGESRAEVRYDVIMQLAVRLTKLDDLILGRLSGKDFHKLSAAIIKAWNASGE